MKDNFQKQFKNIVYVILGIMLLIVLVATMLDKAIGNETMVYQTSLVFYYIANEGQSILENAALLGVKFPEKLRKALEAIQEREDKPPDQHE